MILCEKCLQKAKSEKKKITSKQLVENEMCELCGEEEGKLFSVGFELRKYDKKVINNYINDAVYECLEFIEEEYQCDCIEISPPDNLKLQEAVSALAETLYSFIVADI